MSKSVAGGLFSYFDIYREKSIFNGNILYFYVLVIFQRICREKEKTLLTFYVLLPPMNILSLMMFSKIMISFFPEMLHILTASKRAES